MSVLWQSYPGGFVKNLRMHPFIGHTLTPLALCILATSLMACTTRLGAAQKLFDAGLYSESAEAFERILESDPDNADAKLGLAKSRGELWKKELVSIRLTRMSGNGKGALERLESLLEKTAAWDLSKFQSGDLVSAEEEVRNGRRVLDVLLRAQINDKKPVVATSLWNEFNRVREAKQFGSYSSAAFEDIQKEGRNLCTQLNQMTSNISFSFNQVQKAVCAYYAAEAKNVDLDFQQDYRYARLNIIGEIDALNYSAPSDAQIKIIQTKVDEYLKKAALFSSQSPQILDVKIRGRIMRQYFTQPTMMAHSYQDKVPYEALEDYEDTEFVKVYENGMAQTVPKKVKKTRRVTKYKNELKTHRYRAVKHNESLQLSVVVSANANGEFKTGYSKDKINNFVTHEENLPQIGLTPKEPQFLVVSDWLEGHYTALTAEFITRLKAITADRFCQAVRGNREPSTVAENYSRCAELEPENPAAVAWFTSILGMRRSEVLKTLEKNVL
jgi:hypothetical protein